MPVMEKTFTDAINQIKKGDICPECQEPCLIDGRCFKCETQVKFYHSEKALSYSMSRIKLYTVF